MPTSSVPAVWAALYDLVSGLGLTITRNQTYTLPVSLGPPMSEDASFIGIGYSDGGQVVNGDVEWTGLGTRSQNEDYAIDCVIFVNSGDVDMTTRVTESYGLLAEITEALADDYTLGGTCEVAMVRRHAFTPVQDAAGSAGSLLFTVAVTAQS